MRAPNCATGPRRGVGIVPERYFGVKLRIVIRLTRHYNPPSRKKNMHKTRLTQLIQVLSDNELDGIALNPGPSLFYMTGLSFPLMERPVVCVFTPDKKPLMIIPELEQSKAETSDLEPDLITYGEDEASRLQSFQEAAIQLDLNNRRVAVEPLRLRVLELDLLKQAAPRATFVPRDSVLYNLRVIKDEDELVSMRRAVVIAEEALKNTLPHIKTGVTERELASELTLQLLRAGSETEFPFSPIVASGPNSAHPHAIPSDRTLQIGDLLILDWGATVNGYVSDITRTFFIGEADVELTKVYDIVLEANAVGRDATRPGIACKDIDQASRSVIEAAGYGQYFIHRTGHGIGLEAHEPPYIRGDNPRILETGMAFTIEPGIYLPGRGGVRVEDNIIVTADGGESLSTYPRELEVIG
jgi:Xaa-Pro dipeptidase